MIPNDHISEKGVIYPLIIKSGEEYSGVPPPRLFVDIVRVFTVFFIAILFIKSIFLEQPKSQRIY